MAHLIEYKTPPKKISTKWKIFLVTHYSMRHWNYYSYRKVVRIVGSDKWYKKGQLLKVKNFYTFGGFDYKDRWVDYYDIGRQLKPFWFWKIIFKLKNLFR